MGKQIIIFGFGAQGSAQAQNLKDSGKNVAVYLRSTSKHLKNAKKAGLRVITDASKAAKIAHIAVILINDANQPQFYNKYLETFLPKNAAIIFAHGFNIHYELLKPRSDLDVLLVAPLAQGNALREDYKTGKDIPCLVAVSSDATGGAKEIALDYACAIGRGGPFISTTFKEETEIDLFSEQALLCGGLFELIKAAFDTLVTAGYNPDIAYHCCLKEIRPLADLVHNHGITGSYGHISDTALFGALTRGPRIVDKCVRQSMREILAEIKSGRFKRQLLTDRSKAPPLLHKLIERDKNHLIEKLHKKYK